MAFVVPTRLSFIHWLHSLNHDSICLQELHFSDDAKLLSWFSSLVFLSLVLLETLISKIQGKVITLRLDNLILNSTCNKLTHSNPLCNYLINITRYCIWYSCNAAKFDYKDIDMTILFKIIIKERIQTEFFIYKNMKKNLVDFQALWAYNNVLCTLSDSSLIHLL